MTRQKMTETNKSKDKLQTLIALLESKPELVDVLIDSVVKDGTKKKKPIWRGRELVQFPDGDFRYLTPAQQKAKEIVDALVEKKTLSKTPSEATMNKFYSSGKIRGLSKEDRFWAKHYYKQFILQWSEKKK